MCDLGQVHLHLWAPVSHQHGSENGYPFHLLQGQRDEKAAPSAKQKRYTKRQNQKEGNPSWPKGADCGLRLEGLAGFPKDGNAECRSAHTENLALFTRDTEYVFLLNAFEPQ